MTELFDRVTHVYRCLVSGSLPSLSSAHVAAAVCSGVRGADPAPPGVSSPERCHENGVDVTCASVSLVELMTSLTSRSDAEAALTDFCVETVTLMLQHMDLMTRLVHWFHSDDPIVSHLAARSASACVVHQLFTSGSVSPVWQQKCIHTFHSSPLGAELDACLKSVTDVIKRLCDAAHQGLLGKLLSALDSSLSDLCSKFLPVDSHGLKASTGVRLWAPTFCLLLELLEALSASALVCAAGLRSQNLVQAHAPALLAAIGCAPAPDYYAKKRTLLLVKRVILQRPGEDWAPAALLLSSGPGRGGGGGSDVGALAGAVLGAVGAGWLRSVQVESDSYFGGWGRPLVGGREGEGADCVMLRGVSLLVLKSMELHVQTAGEDSSAEVSQCLQSLWAFVSGFSVQLREAAHACSWVSLLFAEQDDDMMEAAKASLAIFLHHRLSSGPDHVSELQAAACALGCNPHCHFLSLLQSVSFDHSLLLDFLISSETCFLEYSVRYLKYLGSDWQGFCAACERVTESPPEPLIGYDGADEDASLDKAEPEHGSLPLVERLVSGLRLVEYDSSDESESENSETKRQSAGKPVLTGLTKSLQNEPTSQRGVEGLPVLESKGQRSWRDTGETLARAVGCLAELREVVTRLQAKKLFPYNPSSLLRLLAQVEDCCCRQPHPSE